MQKYPLFHPWIVCHSNLNHSLSPAHSLLCLSETKLRSVDSRIALTNYNTNGLNGLFPIKVKWPEKLSLWALKSSMSFYMSNSLQCDGWYFHHLPAIVYVQDFQKFGQEWWNCLCNWANYEVNDNSHAQTAWCIHSHHVSNHFESGTQTNLLTRNSYVLNLFVWSC